MTEKTDRRCFLARGIAGAAGVGAVLGNIEERTLLAATQSDAAQAAAGKRPKTDIPPGSLPCGKIGKVSISRLVIGGNLIGGWAHSRDLMYASKLFTSYNTEAKVFETLELAQECGINTIQIDPRAWGTVLKYNKSRSTKIQIIACMSIIADKTKMNDEIKLRIDQGGTIFYSHGGETDAHMMNGGKIDVIGQMVDLIKAQGVPGGVGGHSLNMLMACEKRQAERRFLRQDAAHRPLLVGHAQGAAEGIRLDGLARRRPRRQQRQYVVQQSRGDDRLHGERSRSPGWRSR